MSTVLDVWNSRSVFVCCCVANVCCSGVVWSCDGARWWLLVGSLDLFLPGQLGIKRIAISHCVVILVTVTAALTACIITSYYVLKPSRCFLHGYLPVLGENAQEVLLYSCVCLSVCYSTSPYNERSIAPQTIRRIQRRV